MTFDSQFKAQQSELRNIEIHFPSLSGKRLDIEQSYHCVWPDPTNFVCLQIMILFAH